MSGSELSRYVPIRCLASAGKKTPEKITQQINKGEIESKLINDAWYVSIDEVKFQIVQTMFIAILDVLKKQSSERPSIDLQQSIQRIRNSQPIKTRLNRLVNDCLLPNTHADEGDLELFDEDYNDVEQSLDRDLNEWAEAHLYNTQVRTIRRQLPITFLWWLAAVILFFYITPEIEGKTRPMLSGSYAAILYMVVLLKMYATTGMLARDQNEHPAVALVTITALTTGFYLAARLGFDTSYSDKLGFLDFVAVGVVTYFLIKNIGMLVLSVSNLRFPLKQYSQPFNQEQPVALTFVSSIPLVTSGLMLVNMLLSAA